MVYAREEGWITGTSMAGTAQEQTMTVEEFLQWNLLQDQRYELVDGHPVPLRAMAGASGQHDEIVVNLIALLRNQLRGSPCRPRTADTAVRTKIKGVRRPDVTIECAPLERNSLEAQKPIAVFEVLSPTTRKIDRSVKLQEYRRHPSIRTIVHIDPDTMDVIVFSKTVTSDWDDARFQKPNDTICIMDTPAELKLSAIYEDVTFEA
jgi:Uma2 family endonuclease